jgi:hypothetical protein
MTGVKNVTWKDVFATKHLNWSILGDFTRFDVSGIIKSL